MGLVVGVLAKFLYPGKESMGWAVTALFGTAGPLAVGFVGQFNG